VSSGALLRSRRDPLFGFSPAELQQWLVSRLAGRVSEAHLFGSVVTNDFGPSSDVDLMIVVDTGLPFVERGSLFDDLRDRLPSLEILVYTPDEFRRLTTDPAPGFWRSVVPTLRQIV
jgi:predicted nucleotidyltransferase